MKCSTKVLVKCKNGIHLRTASHLIGLLKGFNQKVWIRKGSLRIDARSILGILMLQAKKGTSLKLEAYGDKCSGAIETLRDFFNDKEVCFDEKEEF
ncbi:MAG: HPr family phosphocarrier protein [Omnitrophica bacterium]|nr:HPr family phosphocarrier protein [Candidatus Omnitrophota bacterium]